MNADLIQEIAAAKAREVKHGLEPNVVLVDPKVYINEFDGAETVLGMKVVVESQLDGQRFIVAQNDKITIDRLKEENADLKNTLRLIACKIQLVLGAEE